MNERERNILQKRAAKLSAVISEQHKVKKDKRDQALIDNAKARLEIINGWLNPPKIKYGVKRMSKEEFKKILNAPEAKEMMTIDTIKQLKEVWPTIRGKNIQIMAPRHVLHAAKQLAKKDLKR